MSRWCCVWCVLGEEGGEREGKGRCVCTKRPPCLDSKRPRVYRHHAHMLKHMCAWCRHTRGRFESTHGGRFCTHTWRGRGSSLVLLTKIFPRMVITYFRDSPKKPVDFHHFQFENRSRATRCRFLQTFAVPDKAVQFQQS